MLVLSNIHSLLCKVLSPPVLHTAAVFTPAGQLVSFVCDPLRSKDDVLLIVGLSGEVWQGTREKGYGMLESDLGRIVVIPVEDIERKPEDDKPPLMLVALNSTPDMEWSELRSKGKELAILLSQSWSKHREYLTVPKPPPSTISPVVLTTKPTTW